MPAVLPSHPASLTTAARGEEQEPVVPRMHRRPSSQPALGSGSGARPEGLSHFGKPQGAAAPPEGRGTGSKGGLTSGRPGTVCHSVSEAPPTQPAQWKLLPVLVGSEVLL